MSSDYDPRRYWDAIHSSSEDESAVGYTNLARSLNRARYDVERRNVARALHAAGVRNPRRVLDVGSGTGIWIDFWSRRGAEQIVGVDLAEAAVRRLRVKYPQHEFLQLDIGDGDASLPAEMDAVSAMSVLLHITDEARFERALETLLGCVGPNGVLTLTEPVVVHRWWGEPFGARSNSRARPLASYTRVLDRAGFEIVELRPVSCLLTNVIDTRSPRTFHLLERYWELLSRVVGRRERVGSVVGGLLRPLDLLATELVSAGPSSKVIVARRSRTTPRRLRILIVPEWYPSRSHPYAGAFIRDQARGAALAHDVTVVVHDPAPKAEKRAVAVEDGVRTIRIHTRARPGGLAGRLAFVIALTRLLRAMRRRDEAPDLLHAHVFSSGLIALLASRGRLPVVVSEHQSDFIEQVLRRYDRLLARFVFRHAAVVCPVSPTLGAHLQELEPSGRYEVVPNLVDLEPFLALGDRVPRPPGAKRLLVVATLARQKGLGYLLRALAEVQTVRPDVTLDVVGDGPERPELERLAAALLAPGRYTFHGSRTREEVVDFMARSDVFVLPSIVETFGIAAVEAIAAGLPIIVTSALPGHEQLDGRFGIVVPPADPGALRDAVLTMLAKPWSLPREAALELTRPFSPAAVAEQWSEIYRGVRLRSYRANKLRSAIQRRIAGGRAR